MATPPEPTPAEEQAFRAKPRPPIPGYEFGSPALATAPFTLADLGSLQAAVTLTDEDVKYLRMAGKVLEPNVHKLVDDWYRFIGSQPFLLYYFTGPDGQPIEPYLEAVRRRFEQWVLDTCERPYDQQWLNYLYEIGLRHHSTKKNLTDMAPAPPIIHARYLVALIVPVVLTTRPYLSAAGHPTSDVDKMFLAWWKAVTLQVCLWLDPYVHQGEW